MKKAVCFVLIYIFVNTLEAVKPKSVNLALETVLQFDKKDHSADVEVLDRVQSFLDNIKYVMTSSKNAKRRSNTNELKFTDFILEAAEVLKSYEDNDLEDFFAVLDDQSRKYHYRGCKFYELIENNEVRRYMSNKLEQAKDSSAKTMRRYLNDVVKVIASENYNDRNRGLVNLVNSLYDGASDKFDSVVKSLRTYQMRGKDSILNLENIISNALRSLFFDHYSNLNDNARQQLKTEVGNYWLSDQYNGELLKKDRNSQLNHGNDEDFREESKDYKSKLRVIDVPSKFNKTNMHKSDRLKIKSLKGTTSYKKDKRHKSKRPTSKMDIDFLNFKETTRDQPNVATSEEDNTKRNKKQYSFTEGLIDELTSNSYELKKSTKRKKSHKAIIPTKPVDDESGDGTDSDNSSSRDSKDKMGVSIEFSNEKYISKQNKKQATKKHKKQKIGHITYDVERRLKMKAHDYSDDDSSDKDPSDEKTDSNEEVKNPKETVQEDLDEGGLLIGGQNIHDMSYRAEYGNRASIKKGKDIDAEHSDAFNPKVSTKKLKGRQKSSNKTKDVIKTTPVIDTDEESTKKASKIKDSKDSAFASSDEGITIETFENDNESENKHRNLRKSNKPTTASNVHKLIHNLEKQLDDVKEQMKLVTADKANNTELDAQTYAKGIASDGKINNTDEDAQTNAKDISDSKINNTEEDAQTNSKGIESDSKIDKDSAQTDAEVEVSDQNDKGFDIPVNSGMPNNTATDTITTVEYKVDEKIKPNRTTAQELNDTTSKIIKNPTFRSNTDYIDSEKSQESKDTEIISTIIDHKVTKVVKEHKTTQPDAVNETTTLNAKTDSIFKNSEERSVTALGSDDQKSRKENNTSSKHHEESKSKTTLKKYEIKNNIQMITTIIDLTKHLKDSDTVVVNMKDNPKKNIVELKENKKTEIEDFGLPTLPNFQEAKLDDPFNDLDVNLDLMT